MKCYKTYNKVKDIFVKPRKVWFVGKWKNYPGLPMWRHGNMIYLGKYGEYTSKWNYSKMLECNWTDLGKKNHPILSKLFKPIYQFPIWLSFYIFHNDVVWKTKYDDYRYEFPPQFCIVFFGLCIGFHLHNPAADRAMHDDDYWEAILWYLEYKDLEKVKNALGTWFSYSNNMSHDRLNPKFIKSNIT